MFELLGIDAGTVDVYGYFPAGVVYLDAYYLINNDLMDAAMTYDQALILTEDQWEEVRSDMYIMVTTESVFADGYKENAGNNVSNYLEDAADYLGNGANSGGTALFRTGGNQGYSDDYSDVLFHLDLLFHTNSVTYVYGNNGIHDGQGADDGDTAIDTQTYIQGVTIDEANPDFIIPDGWVFEGYYTDPECTQHWDSQGRLYEDMTIYIKLTEGVDVTVDKEDAETEEFLAGAKFQLCKVVQEELYDEEGIPTGETGIFTYYYDFNEYIGWIADPDQATPYTTSDRGDFTMTLAGCDDNTFYYYLTEIEAPEGYALWEESIYFTVTHVESDGSDQGQQYVTIISPTDTTMVSLADDTTIIVKDVAIEDPEKTVDVEDGTEVSVGDELTYTITYQNPHASAVDVTITDVLDEGLDFVSATPEGTYTYDEGTNTVIWTINDVEAYAKGSVTLTVTVNENAPQEDNKEVTNTATVQIGDEDAVDTNQVENPVEDPEDPEKTSNVPEGADVEVGDSITYTISYKNGHSEEADVIITDVLDVGLDFVEASDGGIYDEATRTVTWTIESIEAYTEGSVTVTVLVNEDAIVEGEVENTASVQIGDDSSVDTNPVTTRVEDPEDPTKGVSVGDGAGVLSEDELTYTIAYYNYKSTDATVVITDTLDEALTYVDGSASNGGVYDEASRTITWTFTAGALERGTVSFQATVNSEPGQTIENAAQVKVGDDDPMGSNTVENPIEEPQYFPLDEEIVPDQDDILNSSEYVKAESVNEYDAIEFEISTTLPKVSANALKNGEYEMLFHDQLVSGLELDEVDADFSVYINGIAVDHSYYTVEIMSGVQKTSLVQPLSDTDDDCSFHVSVDLSALYNAGIITDEDLGTASIQVFFFADLEDVDINGTFTSTAWYQLYDGETLLYTSDPDVVEVYTYEIIVQKYDDEALTDGDFEAAALAGATLGLYYDEDCTKPVSRNGADYTYTTGDDGQALFVGIAEGTYYVKELSAPDGYALSDKVLGITVGGTEDHVFYGYYANTPEDIPEPNPETVDIEGSKIWSDSNDSFGTRPESITIRLLADGEEVASATVTADDEWTWCFADMPKYQEDGTTEIIYTITEDAVDSYTTTIDGYDVTNTFTPPTDEPIPTPEDKTMNIKVTKVWEGDLEDLRPASVEISLLASGEVCDTVLLNADNNWTYTWSDLPVYDEEEVAIQYTIKEAEVPEGYTVSYGDWESSDGTYTIIVTNTFDEELLTGPGPEIDNPDGSNSNPTGETKTGDVNMSFFWIMLMIAAAALVVAIVTMRTRSRMIYK